MKRLERGFDPDLELLELVSAVQSGIWSRAEYVFERLKLWNDTGGHLPSLRQGINKSEDNPLRNPSLVTYANPPKGGKVMSDRVYQVKYEHMENGQDYYHDFDDGVEMIALPDKNILLKSDKDLWEDFD